MKTFLIRSFKVWAATCIIPIVFFPVAWAATYYVAVTGNDLNPGTSADPFATITKGISKMVGGDTLIVKAGIYAGRANFITGVPSGTSAAYSVVMAETPMDARITNSSSETLDYNEHMVNLPGQYIKVDGFVFDQVNSLYPPHNGQVDGSYNKITRSIFRRAGAEDTYGGLLVLYGSNNLVEDVAGVGACRYCFEQGSPTGVTKYNIWRRVVGRFDYSGSDQPKRTITTYGNDSGPGVSDHLYQNVVALDGNDVDTGRTGSSEVKYSGIGVGKSATNVTFQGCIVLNENVAYAGIFASVWGTGNKVTNSVVWDLIAPTGVMGIRADMADTTADHVTIGGRPMGSYFSVQSNPVTPPFSALGGTYANLTNNTPGAVVMKRYGVSGTLWGEPGYDQLTNEDLWPWPYEDKIKTVFSETNDTPNIANYLPTTNNTKRGFAAAGAGLYGGPITLTSYIWEYLGTACPTNICGGAVPPPPPTIVPPARPNGFRMR